MSTPPDIAHKLTSVSSACMLMHNASGIRLKPGQQNCPMLGGLGFSLQLFRMELGSLTCLWMALLFMGPPFRAWSKLLVSQTAARQSHSINLQGWYGVLHCLLEIVEIFYFICHLSNGTTDYIRFCQPQCDLNYSQQPLKFFVVTTRPWLLDFHFAHKIISTSSAWIPFCQPDYLSVLLPLWLQFILLPTPEHQILITVWMLVYHLDHLWIITWRLEMLVGQ